MRYMFVINPTAGAGRRDIPAFQAQVARFCDDFDVRLTSAAGDAEQLSAEASLDGYDVVVAVGGDGTVNEVGRGLLRHRGASLGIIPSGSGNGVARRSRAQRTMALERHHRGD